MKKLYLRGPFELTEDSIHTEVELALPGVFVLGGSGVFSDRDACVGRSDTNVALALADYIGRYRYFNFVYCASAKLAFEDQCDLYHELRPCDTPLHPARLPGTSWICPRCGLAEAA